MSEQGQVQRFGAAVLMGLPETDGETRQYWIDNPAVLKEALSGLGRTPCPELKVWKTIKLGVGPKTADDFRKAIKAGGMKVGDWANDTLGKPEFVVVEKAMEVDLVKVTVAELGFKKGAQRDQIYTRAKEFGLELCPPEIGPRLRLHQPNGELIFIGMEPIRDSDGYLRVFHVVHDGNDQWLGSRYGDPGPVWSAGTQWVFVHPRK